MIEINLGFLFAQKVGEKFSRLHTGPVVLKVSQELALVKLRDLGVQTQIDLTNEPILAKAGRFKQCRPVDFFFMRASILEAHAPAAFRVQDGNT